MKETFGSAKDVLSLNTHSAQPSASLKAFNNYFCYQDGLKNVFSFPTKTFNVYIPWIFFRDWDLFLALQQNSWITLWTWMQVCKRNNKKYISDLGKEVLNLINCI